MLFNQRQITEEAEFTFFPLGKAFEKETKMIEDQRKDQIDPTTNQNKKLEVSTNNERLEALTNKHIYKKIFDETVKEKCDEIRAITDEINHDYLTYCFKEDTAKKRFHDFNNGIKI